MADEQKFDAGDLFDKILATRVTATATAGDMLGQAGDFARDNAAGLGLGALGAVLLGTRAGRSISAGALKIGGVALVGALAYKAYKNWSDDEENGRIAREPGDTADAALVDHTYSRPARVADPQHSLALVQAMIMAAKADGRIDADEQRRILERLETLELGPQAYEFLRTELQKPIDMEPIVAAATGPEKAAELYLASVLAIDPDTDSEKGYLAVLAERLKLKRGLINEIHAAAEEVRV